MGVTTLRSLEGRLHPHLQPLPLLGLWFMTITLQSLPPLTHCRLPCACVCVCVCARVCESSPMPTSLTEGHVHPKPEPTQTTQVSLPISTPLTLITSFAV